MQKEPPRRAASRAAAMSDVFDATVGLFHRLRAAAEEVHRQGRMTAGRRGVLRDLARNGPQTVPQMARSRPVTRQHIQALVNPLAKEGYVEFAPNPAHKRSHLVRLTPKGEAFVRDLTRREAAVLDEMAVHLSRDELRAAARVLRELRAALESPEWRRAAHPET